MFYKLIDANKSTKNDGRNAGQGLATRMCLAPPRVTSVLQVIGVTVWVVALVAEYLLENADFYAKNQKRFKGSDTTFIFRLRKNGRKKPIRLTETVQSAG
ncbi:MAG: hypothetical protein MZV70_23685 [Desulfobacterales bacterium]|nr:hypothetical protein [Desulfobacterales bacterium]